MRRLLSFASAILVIAPYLVSAASAGSDAVSDYKRRPEVAHVQCDRLFKGDTLYATGLPRQRLIPNESLDMECEAVRKRVLSRRNPKTGLYLAFVKLVYKDYELIEEQLAVSYNEEHTFCFAIDKKSPPEFHSKVKKLSSCFDNVLLASEEHELGSTGCGQSRAQLDCLQQVRSDARQWFYVILQQNHDIMLKTNAEMAHIFRIMAGANDIEWSKCPGDGRCSIKEKNLGKLGICPENLNESERAACEKEEITMAKGAIEMSLTYETVEYLLDTLNTTGLIGELHQRLYGMDELFIQSIAATRALKMPGMYPARCRVENDAMPPSSRFVMTRIAIWKWFEEYGCASGIWRHNVCIFGVEDLPYLAGVHHLMANKMMPDADYAAISCMGELLYNRTHLGLNDHPLNKDIYKNLPAVRLRKGVLEDPTYFDRFKCPKVSQAPPPPGQQNSALIQGLQSMMLILSIFFLY